MDELWDQGQGQVGDNSDIQSAGSGTAGIRAVLLLLSALVSPATIFESPQLQALQVPGSSEEPMDANRLHLRLRFQFFPLVQHIWAAQWLLKCPLSTMKLAVKSFLIVMDDKDEEPSVNHREPLSGPNTTAPTRAAIVADPERINQLVEMGFAPGAAEYALTRARNNVAAAADLILSMPHLFPPEIPRQSTVESEQPMNLIEAQGSGADSEEPVRAELESAIDVEPVLADVSAVFGTETDVSSAPPPSGVEQNNTSLDSTIEKLKGLRKEYGPNTPVQALAILDHADDLVHDLLPALPKGSDGALFLIQHTIRAANTSTDQRDTALSARLRLLAVFLRSDLEVNGDQTILQTAGDLIASLHVQPSDRASWTCPWILFGEAILALSEIIIDTKMGQDVAPDVFANEQLLLPIIEPYLPVISAILDDEKASREEVLSVLRLLAVVTRRFPHLAPVSSARSVLQLFRQPTPRLQGCQPYVAMIIRHSFETRSMLDGVMRQEIQQYLSPARNKVTDVNHFVRQLRQSALRSPNDFLRAVERECALVDPAPPQSVYHIRALDESASISCPHVDDAGNLHPHMEVLIGELSYALSHVERKLPDHDHSASTELQSYAGFLLSALTEVVGCYMPVKMAFLSIVQTPCEQEEVSRRSSLSSMINETICGLDLSIDLNDILDSQRTNKVSQRLLLSSWCSSFIVALCSDVNSSSQSKSVSDDLVTVRKTVFEIVAKSLRDGSASSSPSTRYAKLWALGELVHRLLIGQSSPGIGGALHTSSAQTAKLMIEKNFVGLLTAAIGEVDLNFPGVRVVLAALLKALDFL